PGTGLGGHPAGGAVVRDRPPVRPARAGQHGDAGVPAVVLARRLPRSTGLAPVAEGPGPAGRPAHAGLPRQALPWNSSRPISMRRISLVPAPISYSFASRNSRPAGNSLM